MAKSTVTIPSVECHSIDDYIVDAVVKLYSHRESVAAIKLLRAHTDLGLKTSKDICDKLWEVHQRHVY